MQQTTLDVGKELWDVLVIGAGPAGAFAARELSRRGMKTLLVESKSFPRDKVCGGCINGRALLLLRSVGLGTLCDDLGGKTLSAVELRAGSQELHIPLPMGFAVSRRAMDTALVREAIRKGVEFLPETKATVTAETDSRSRLVLLRQRDFKTIGVHSKVVLACDGLNHSSLRRLPLFQSRVAPRARVGIGGIIEDDSCSYPEERIVMAVGRRGYVGITHVENGQINVAAAVDAEFVHEFGRREAVLRLLQHANIPVAESMHRISLHGTPLLTRHTPNLAAERLFLLGDAAGYIEPFTGEGIAMAWSGAQRIVPLAVQAVARWDSGYVQEWQRKYRQTIEKRLRICRTLTSLIRHPWAVRATLGVFSACPGLCDPIVGRINNTSLDLKACKS